jgi:geranylgeranylglycerol-phosphate geranylgeranyltransferase
MNKYESGFIQSLVLLFKSRTNIIFAFSWSAAFGCLIAGGGFPPIRETILAILASVFLPFSVYLYNDVIDREMDAASSNGAKKDRPVATGLVYPRTAMLFVIISSILGLIVTYLINFQTFTVSLFFFILFSLYSFPYVRFKKMFVIKSLVTSTGPSLFLIIGGTAVQGFTSLIVLFAAAMQMGFMFTMLPGLADSFDLEEDRAFGMKTMAMVLSWRQKVIMMITGTMFVVASTLISFRWLGLNIITPVLMVGYGILYMGTTLKVIGNYEENYARIVRKVAYGYFVLMPLFTLLGTLNLGIITLF